MVNNWLKNILFTLLPQTCLLCGSTAHNNSVGLCTDCQKGLPSLPSSCFRCANPLADLDPDTPQLCGSCLQHPPAFDATLAAFPYQLPIDSLIQGLKFRQQLSSGRVLATLLADFLQQHNASAECIIPVPLHAKRLRQRGFNQALELARPVARRLGIPIDNRLCQRRHNTETQSSLPVNKRRQNVRNAFIVTQPCDYRHVAIVDDVMTSGHTANALATTLKQHGVEKVSVWTCARVMQEK